MNARPHSGRAYETERRPPVRLGVAKQPNRADQEIGAPPLKARSSLRKNISRRNFLLTTAKASVLATAGLAASGAVSAPAHRPGLIDVNVTLGRWPFRRLPLDETGKLVAKLRGQGVTQAWAGSFDAVFGKDLRAANSSLAECCRKHGRGLLLPFGTVNPKAPDWEAELRRCVEQHRMRGLRLFPAYHGYKLNDAAFARLFAHAKENQLVLQIATDLEDERMQRAEATAAHTDAKPLLALLKENPGGRVVLLNWQRSVPAALGQPLAAAGAHFEIATVESVGGVAELIARISVERVLFGSHAPFFYLESAQLKLEESALTGQTLRSVSELNARRLLG